ncbi:MAG: sigma-70 family RNA polymerase sigma factor [Phycisphaeraceae bacterium]
MNLCTLPTDSRPAEHEPPAGRTPKPRAMSEQPVTNPSLLVRLRDPADGGAWETFSEIYEPLIFAFCRKRGLQEADARDVTQDTLVSVIRAIQKFEYDPAHGKFRSWLYRVIRSKLANHFSKSAKQVRGSGQTVVNQMLNEQPGAGEEQAFDREAEQRVFEWACEKVRPEFEDKTWQAFVRVAVKQEKSNAVAEALGMSVGAVYIAKSRVIKRLQATIQDASDWTC